MFGLLIIMQKKNSLKLAMYFMALCSSRYLGMDTFFYHCVLIYEYTSGNYRLLGFIAITIVYMIIDHPLQVFILAGVPLLYIDKDIFGKLNRWVKYSVYPAHYALILIIKSITG